MQSYNFLTRIPKKYYKNMDILENFLKFDEEKVVQKGFSNKKQMSHVL